MKYLPFCLFSILLLCAVRERIYAQPSGPDTASSGQPAAYLYSLYSRELAGSLRIYNGDQYIPYGKKTKNAPFYASDSLLQGDVFYDGTLYREIGLLYDQVSDDIIINNPDNSGKIKLVGDKIRYFKLQGHLFVRLNPDSQGMKMDGFYDWTYSGRVNVFVKREKKMEFAARAEDDVPRYVEYKHYFIGMGARYYPVSSEKSLLDLLSDHKSLLKKYLRSSGLKFRKKPEETINAAASYYSQLKN